MKKLFHVVVLGAASLSSRAFADEGKTNPGLLAYAAIANVEPALKSDPPSVRRACQTFGQYQAYKATTTKENSSFWILRNLKYNEDEDKTLDAFCVGSDSKVTVLEAISAAQSIRESQFLE